MSPGEQLEDGQNYYQWFQYLLTNLSDHTLRIGRLEQLMEQIFAQLNSAQTFTHPAQTSAHDTTTYDSDTTIRHDIGTLNGFAQRPQLRAKRTIPHQKFASDIKRREVREYYAQYYPRMNQQQIADHFGISVRTLQRYLEE